MPPHLGKRGHCLSWLHCGLGRFWALFRVVVKGHEAAQPLGLCTASSMESGQKRKQVSASLSSSCLLPLQGTGGPDFENTLWNSEINTLKVPTIPLEIRDLFSTAERLAKNNLETNQSRDTTLRVVQVQLRESPHPSSKSCK